ncbi:flippase-like domain-containing protein [archaeon]|nr:flippase-like domain-containing protein [archaeon]MBT4373128.1 flippase-like domain-containing protein [archaeon]MBT4531473.1 flippase-like domain-containing protein [archaeon]MBT7001349.1 flippase-like domain-containing protein [archaeon]MBT7282165.1 flippase-like domain-containing protein [archaeon]
MKVKKILPLIGIGIFLYILFRLDFRRILSELKNIRIEFLIVALIFLSLSVLSQTFKWFIIARTQKIKVRFPEALKANLIGEFYGFITPSKVGSLTRMAYIKKCEGYNHGKGASNYVLEKILDVCSLIFLAVIFSFVFQKVLPQTFVYYSVVLFFILFSLLIFFRDKERTKKIFRGIYHKFIPKKIKQKVKNGFNSFYEDMPQKRFFLIFFIINLINWIILYLFSFFIGLSLSINVPFFYFLAILPIATLVGLIPITISGLGTREATLISLFGLFGISATKVFSMSILSLIGGTIPAIIGIFLIFRSRSK